VEFIGGRFGGDKVVKLTLHNSKGGVIRFVGWVRTAVAVYKVDGLKIKFKLQPVIKVKTSILYQL
jgi:hypothetical protein